MPPSAACLRRRCCSRPELQTQLQPASELFETLQLTEQQAIDLTHGRRIHIADREGPGGGPVAAIAPGGHLVGLIEFRGKEARTLVNFPTDEIATA